MRAGWDLSLNWITSKSLDCIVCFIDSGFIDCPRAPLAVPITTNVAERERKDDFKASQFVFNGDDHSAFPFSNCNYLLE